MKKAKKEVEKTGFKCYLPKFSLDNGYGAKKIEKIKNKRRKDRINEENLEKIIEVKKWYYRKLRDCDVLVVFDIGGYIGLSVAAEIGAAYVLEKPTFLLKEPKDNGLCALIKSSKNFKIISFKNLTKELKRLTKSL